MDIRVATTDDVRAVQTVGLLTWPATYLAFTSPAFVLDGLATWWTEQSVLRAIVGSTTFVAEADGAVIGTATLGDLDGEAVLWRLYVLPERQGSGAGSALLQAVSDAAGAGDLLVEVTTGNTRALASYDRGGFRREREEPGPFGTTTTWLRRPGRVRR